MPNIFDAINYAMQICWDERYGYRYSGHAANPNDGVDCGGLVFHCLNRAGFPGIPDTSPGVRNMANYLINAGFTQLPYDRNTFVPQDGDIFCCYHPGDPDDPEDERHGHTFFYAENIRAYTDPSAVSANISNVAHAKIEASGTRGRPGPGDSRQNGTGAYNEVWCHAYASIVNHNTYADSEVKVYRIGGSRINKWMLFNFQDRKKHPLPFNPNLLI